MHSKGSHEEFSLDHGLQNFILGGGVSNDRKGKTLAGNIRSNQGCDKFQQI